MLSRDGKFIQESKPVIGGAYVPYKTSNASREEEFMQGVLLAKDVNRSALMKFVSKILWV